MAVGGLRGFDELKAEVGDTRDKLADPARSKGHRVLAKGLAELRAVRPLLRDAGFDVVDIVLTVAVPPSFTVVVQPRAVDEIDLEGVLARPDLTKTQTALLRAVSEVYVANDLIEADGFAINRIGIEMGTPPRIRLDLRPRDELG